MIENKQVLVTGGAGFIGSNLCENLLEHGNKVTCMDNFLTGKKSNIGHLIGHGNFTLLEGDIRNPIDCNKGTDGIEIVLHQAALGSVPRSINDPLTTNEININGFLNILYASKEQGVKRFVYAASSSTYGDSKELPKKEEIIGMPLSPYAVTKYVNELYAHVFSNLYRIETIGLRYFNVFGRKQDPNGAYAAAIPKFIKAFMNHESPKINGDGSQTRDFTYIDNVIQANHLAGSTQNKVALNKVFNIACGDQSILLDLVENLRLLLSNFDSKIASVKITHGPERVGDVKHSLASIEKAQSLLNYQPTHNVSKGLNEAIEWYWNNL